MKTITIKFEFHSGKKLKILATQKILKIFSANNPDLKDFKVVYNKFIYDLDIVHAIYILFFKRNYITSEQLDHLSNKGSKFPFRIKITRGL